MGRLRHALVLLALVVLTPAAAAACGPPNAGPGVHGGAVACAMGGGNSHAPPGRQVADAYEVAEAGFRTAGATAAASLARYSDAAASAMDLATGWGVFALRAGARPSALAAACAVNEADDYVAWGARWVAHARDVAQEARDCLP